MRPVADRRRRCSLCFLNFQVVREGAAGEGSPPARAFILALSGPPIPFSHLASGIPGAAVPGSEREPLSMAATSLGVRGCLGGLSGDGGGGQRPG